MLQRVEGDGLHRKDTSRPVYLRFVLSVLCSALALAAVGCVCALFYPVIKELRALRVKADDGTEQRMLGFWSILLLSLAAACLCSTSSWLLTHLNSSPSRTTSMGPFQNSDSVWLDYGVAVLNGFMAMITVSWSLT